MNESHTTQLETITDPGDHPHTLTNSAHHPPGGRASREQVDSFDQHLHFIIRPGLLGSHAFSPTLGSRSLCCLQVLPLLLLQGLIELLDLPQEGLVCPLLVTGCQILIQALETRTQCCTRLHDMDTKNLEGGEFIENFYTIVKQCSQNISKLTICCYLIHIL